MKMSWCNVYDKERYCAFEVNIVISQKSYKYPAMAISNQRCDIAKGSIWSFLIKFKHCDLRFKMQILELLMTYIVEATSISFILMQFPSFIWWFEKYIVCSVLYIKEAPFTEKGIWCISVTCHLIYENLIYDLCSQVQGTLGEPRLLSREQSLGSPSPCQPSHSFLK